MFLFRHSRSLLLYNVYCFVPSAIAKARLGTNECLFHRSMMKTVAEISMLSIKKYILGNE